MRRQRIAERVVEGLGRIVVRGDFTVQVRRFATMQASRIRFITIGDRRRKNASTVFLADEGTGFTNCTGMTVDEVLADLAAQFQVL